jgi:hypothetical protein
MRRGADHPARVSPPGRPVVVQPPRGLPINLPFPALPAIPEPIARMCEDCHLARGTEEMLILQICCHCCHGVDVGRDGHIVLVVAPACTPHGRRLTLSRRRCHVSLSVAAFQQAQQAAVVQPGL